MRVGTGDDKQRAATAFLNSEESEKIVEVDQLRKGYRADFNRLVNKFQIQIFKTHL